jgi:5-formaminoimidazole-4-carboxamide-1-beta-D-ribofuranosyl 5'-monophosphate synthetase
MRKCLFPLAGEIIECLSRLLRHSLKKFTPKLQGPATKEVMATKLEQYAIHDPAPRIKQSIATIINSWESI